MDALARQRDHARMPLDLTDPELETAARACRALAYQEEQAAKRMENPTMRGPIENTAKRAAALAEKPLPVHSRSPSKPRPPLTARRESFADRAAHRHESRSPDCLLVHAGTVGQAPVGVTTGFLM
jgi:acetyl-CoA carboxylase beta subunit